MCSTLAAKFGWLEIASYVTSVILDMKKYNLPWQYHLGFLKKTDTVLFYLK